MKNHKFFSGRIGRLSDEIEVLETYNMGGTVLRAKNKNSKIVVTVDSMIEVVDHEYIGNNKFEPPMPEELSKFANTLVSIVGESTASGSRGFFASVSSESIWVTDKE